MKMHLQQQFTRLYTACGEPPERIVVLAEIAGYLQCSTRNARSVLNRMMARGWVCWMPGLGRGNQSKIVFKTTPSRLILAQAEALVREGDLLAAAAKLDSAGLKARLDDLLIDALGDISQGTQQAIRIPFYRPLHGLDPTHCSRRTEAHIINQVFDTLLSYNRKTESLEPSLAHCWRQEAEARCWIFYLRPGVVFHHGRELECKDVQASFERQQQEHGTYRSLFMDIEQIHCIDKLTVKFELRNSDWYFPNLVASTCCAIQPFDLCRQKKFKQLPVGTGPFKVVQNDRRQIRLQAHARFFGTRALLDEINIWIVRGQDVTAKCQLAFRDRKSYLPVVHEEQVQLEQGCFYLAFNQHKARFRSAKLRKALASVISTKQICNRIQGKTRLKPAAGLLPRWMHVTVSAPLTQQVNIKKLRLVSYQNPTCIEIAELLQEYLGVHGIKLETEILQYPEFIKEEFLERADIVLLAEVVDDDLPYSLFQWLSSTAAFRSFLSRQQTAAMDQQLIKIRAQANAKKRWVVQEAMFRQLVQEYHLLPLFHTWQQIFFDPLVRGIDLASCGWVSFKDLWLLPKV